MPIIRSSFAYFGCYSRFLGHIFTTRLCSYTSVVPLGTDDLTDPAIKLKPKAFEATKGFKKGMMLAFGRILLR